MCVEVSSGERVRVYGSRTHEGIKFQASMKFQFIYYFFLTPSLSASPFNKRHPLKALGDDSAWAVSFACRHLFIMPPPLPSLVSWSEE